MAMLASNAAAWTVPSWWRNGNHNVEVVTALETNVQVQYVYKTVYAGENGVAPAQPTAVAEVSSVAAAAPTTFVQVTKSVSKKPKTSTSQAAVAAPATTSAAAAAAETTAASSSSGSLDADSQGALDAHNAARAEVGNPDLEWDDSLASDAQSWADNLASTGTFEHSGASGQGENLYMSSGSGSSTPFTDASNMWIDEKSSYSGQAIGDGDFSAYGHYSK